MAFSDIGAHGFVYFKRVVGLWATLRPLFLSCSIVSFSSCYIIPFALIQLVML